MQPWRIACIAIVAAPLLADRLPARIGQKRRDIRLHRVSLQPCGNTGGGRSGAAASLLPFIPARRSWLTACDSEDVVHTPAANIACPCPTNWHALGAAKGSEDVMYTDVMYTDEKRG